MVYGYSRVSSRGQQRAGNSLSDQRKLLENAGAQTIIEECFSGVAVERPQFSELIRKLQPGDTIIVSKMDRFARTAAEGALLVKRLVERGITVNILNMGVVQRNPTGKLLLHVMLAFAEFEHDMIVERTQAGKEIARQNPGYREGRPKKFTSAQVSHALELLRTHSYRQVSEMTGISKSTLVRAKQNHNITNQNL